MVEGEARKRHSSCRGQACIQLGHSRYLTTAMCIKPPLLFQSHLLTSYAAYWFLRCWRRGVAQRLAEEYRAGLGNPGPGSGPGPRPGSVAALPGSPSRATPASPSRPDWAGIPSRRAVQDDRAEKRRYVRSGAVRWVNVQHGANMYLR